MPEQQVVQVTLESEVSANARIAVAGGTPSAEQVSAQRLREHVRSHPTTSLREGPKAIRESFVSDERIKAVKEQNIGWRGKDATTGNLVLDPGAEQARSNNVDSIVTTVQTYLEDFGALNGIQRLKLRDTITSVFNDIPSVKLFFDSLNPTEKGSIIENFLRDPRYRGKVREILAAKLNQRDGNQTTQRLTEVVRSAEGERSKVRNEQTVIAEQYTHKEGDLNDVNQQLREFVPAVRGRGGRYLQEIENLTDEKPRNTIEVQKRQNQITHMNGLLTRLYAEQQRNLDRPNTFNDLQTQIDRLGGELDRVSAEMLPYQRDLNRLDYLNAQKVQLEDDRSRLEDERNTLYRQLGEVTGRVMDTERAFNEAKDAKANDEQKFINELNDTLSDAAFDHLDAEFSAMESKRDEMLQEESKNSTDKFDKAMLDQMRTRWTMQKEVKDTFFGKRRTTIKTDEKAVASDYTVLLTDGPEALMRTMLIEGGAGLTPPLTPADIDAKLADPAFVAKMQSQVVENVMSRRFMTGKVTKDEALHLWNTPWGETAITNALSKNQRLNTELQKLRDQGVLRDDGKFVEWFKKSRLVKGVGILAILALIFGAGATALGYGPLASIIGAGGGKAAAGGGSFI